jgi:cytochrome c oxidase subunit 4
MAGDQTQSEAGGQHGVGGVGHIVPVKVLAATGFALLVLTAITVWVASFDFGNVNIWVALSIAALKASLVVLFFMHLRYDRPFNGIIFVTSLAFVTLFIAFALTDHRWSSRRSPSSRTPSPRSSGVRGGFGAPYVTVF